MYNVNLGFGIAKFWFVYMDLRDVLCAASDLRVNKSQIYFKSYALPVQLKSKECQGTVSSSLQNWSFKIEQGKLTRKCVYHISLFFCG